MADPGPLQSLYNFPFRRLADLKIIIFHVFFVPGLGPKPEGDGAYIRHQREALCILYCTGGLRLAISSSTLQKDEWFYSTQKL